MAAVLSKPLHVRDLYKASRAYNELPRIEPQMTFESKHINPLLDIISRHGHEKTFGIHGLHRHDKIQEHSVRLESKLNMGEKKILPTPIRDLNPDAIHAVMFKFSPSNGGFIPFEFGKGLSPIHESAVDVLFIHELQTYFVEHNLGNTFALEILDENPYEGCTAEVETENGGTIVLPKEKVTAKAFLPTGWSGLPSSDDSTPPPGQTWAEKTDGSHKVFQN
ncbi:hypothetical protein ACKAV7_005411 [Fusarium commune]